MTYSDIPMFGYPVADWHAKFAWVPVNTYDQGWKWLRYVERRKIHPKDYVPTGPWWQYRASR